MDYERHDIYWKIGLAFCLILGTFFANLVLFVIPKPFYGWFWFKRTTGDHPPMQHLAAVLNCMVWILYGLPLVQADIFVIVNNAVGCFIGVVYLILFAIYSKSWDNRRNIVGFLILEVIVVSIVATVVLGLVDDIKLRYHIIGTLAVICQSGTYVAPLSAMKLSIATASVEHISKTLTFASGSSCVMWLAYAMVSHADIINYLFVANAIGCVVALLEPFVYAVAMVLEEKKKMESINGANLIV